MVLISLVLGAEVATRFYQQAQGHLQIHEQMAGKHAALLENAVHAFIKNIRDGPGRSR